jgi:UDP-glucuronate 4-epimerase
MSKKKILVTGAAGFIGMHLVEDLLKHEYIVLGIDNINDYYDIELKYSRLELCGIKRGDIRPFQRVESRRNSNYTFIQLDLINFSSLHNVFETDKFDAVIHLAAQAGVRYSVENPKAYLDSNILGFFNIIELSRINNVKTFVYASSSSVYGNCDSSTFKEDLNVDKPESFYAATKKTNELIAYSYNKIYNLQTTGLRFFTVYGPWGRPDMAYFSFTESILNDQPIKLFNKGVLFRDFTYIDDIINGIIKVFQSKLSSENRGYEILNIGNNKPVLVLDFVEILEKKLGKTAIKILSEMQVGDVNKTVADLTNIKRYGYETKVNIEEGLSRFVDWYNQYNEK